MDAVSRHTALRFAPTGRLVAGWTAALLLIAPSSPLAGSGEAGPIDPTQQDGPMLLLAPGPSASYIDFFPQDLNSYQIGGWRDAVNGDGTGGTVQAGLDSSSILLDGTLNALAYALRNAPVAHDFEMSIDFAIVNQQMSPEDRLTFLLRFKDPILPAACCFGGSGQVHASSGLRLELNLGRGTITPFREKNGAQGPALAPPTLVSIGFGQPHRMVISYRGGVLTATQDGVPAGSWRTPNLPAGRVGLEVYRLDLAVSDLSLTVF